MGLFSFLKNAGSNILSKVTGTPTAPKKVELSKTEALKAEIKKLGLPVDNLSIELGEQIIINGKTPDNATEASNVAFHFLQCDRKTTWEANASFLKC